MTSQLRLFLLSIGSLALAACRSGTISVPDSGLDGAADAFDGVTDGASDDETLYDAADGELQDTGPDGGDTADGQATDDGELSDEGAATDDGSGSQDEGSPSDGADGGVVEPLGTVSGVIRINHFGWRPEDRKQVVLQERPQVTVELRRTRDNSIAASFTSSALSEDEDSLDRFALVDFSSFTEEGEYYFYLPGENLRSYVFVIDQAVYNLVGQAAVKSFYFQRCNHEKVLPYATDALPGSSGLGGQWIDEACHLGDYSAKAGPGSPDNGQLDVHGGWHDAGDYQKTLWGRGVPEMLFAYEINPAVWKDNQLNLPESGNGAPDLLDELAWELDFYTRMQRPDGHFMTSVKGRDDTSVSPPSTSDQERVYFDSTSPSGDGWSGGGVTVGEATGNAVLSLAHAAMVFEAAHLSQAAARYHQAALAGWQWLSSYTPQNDTERRLRAAAAAAVFRLDSSISSARSVVEQFAWDTFDGQLPWSATPSERVMTAGCWHILLNSQASEALKQKVRAGISALVERAFSQEGAYGGMFGSSQDGWDYSWGSNSHQSMYGANLFMALRFGISGDHTPEQAAFLAQKHFHYMLGLNPLNMVYLTNMAAYGGEHSSFQIYHGWFSYTGGDGDHGNALYNGKPASVPEPLYPYYPQDNQTSRYGPAPGLVPGGPNYYYSCEYEIPNRQRPAYAYRDFSVGCDWSGSACRGCSWEITEPMNAYQGPFVLLVSFMMSAD